MSRTKISLIFAWGLTGGFVCGSVQAAIAVARQGYIQQGMFRLAIRELARSLISAELWGLAIAVAVVVFLKLILHLWEKNSRPRLKVSIENPHKFRFFLYQILLVGMLAYGLWLGLAAWFIKEEAGAVLTAKNAAVAVMLLVLTAVIRWKVRFRSVPARLILRTGWGAAGLCGIVLAVTLALKIVPPVPGPNVLLVVADALRPDHLGCFGYDKPTSPQIDAFSRQSVVFEQAVSNAPWTKPSMGTLFTSLYPYEHQALSWTDSLEDKCLTWSESLQNGNYATFAVQTNPALTKSHNFQQGFDEFQENLDWSASDVVDAFSAWAGRRKKPFFAYLHFMDTHVPYNAPEEFTKVFRLRDNPHFQPGQFETLQVRILTYLGLSPQDKLDIQSLYDAAIRTFDRHFGRLLQRLEELEQLENTIIILLADHGEEFWEHGGFAHGHSLYNEVLHVPLMIRYPHRLDPKRIDAAVSLKDVYPTVLHLLKKKSRVRVRGRNLLPLIFNAGSSGEDPIFLEGILFGEEKKGMLWKNWKLIKNIAESGHETLPLVGSVSPYVVPPPPGDYEFFDLSTDFQETTDVADLFPDPFQRMKNQLRAFSIAHGTALRKRMDDLSKKQQDLKALGYLK
jgi:arylsulfatase A-like enzyme